MAVSTNSTMKSVRPSRVTLADVAARAGCSTALVSTVINRSSTNAGASAAMTERIRVAARELGYRADFASQSLARRSTRTIGVYVPSVDTASLAHPYEGAVLRGIERICQKKSYDLLAINLGGKVSPQSCIDRFAERRIDGLVLLSVAASDAWVSRLVDHQPNVVAVNYHGPEGRLQRVNFDDHRAIALATEHLISLGHRDIAFAGLLTEDPGPGAAHRREAFEQSMRNHNLPINPDWVIDSTLEGNWPDPIDDHIVTGKWAAEHLQKSEKHPTGVVCYGDLIAIGVCRTLKQAGLSVPNDVSVTGVDDMTLCEFVEPALTTVSQPLEQMGRRVTEILFEKITGEQASGAAPVSVELSEPTLVVRESTARAAR